MKSLSSLLPRALLALLLTTALAVSAQEPPAKTDAPPPSPPAAPAAPAANDANAPTQPAEATAAAEKSESKQGKLRRLDEPDAETATSPSASSSSTSSSTSQRRTRSNGTDFPFGDHAVQKDSRVRDVISILGSSTVEGEVDSDAVSVLGNTTIGPDARIGGAAVAVLGKLSSEGRIGDEAVSVLGGVYINGEVRGEVVAVLGNIELGPKADIGGDLVLVGGALKKSPGAKVHGNEVRVPFMGPFGTLDWLITWFKRCVLLGRPLAFGEHLGWAWLVAGSFLVFYLLLALLFPRGVEKCAATLETRPGSTIIASVLTVLLSPVAIVLLAVTVVGALLIPFFGAGMVIAKLFGKAVMLAWIGRRLTKMMREDGSPGHPVVAVLIGGVIVMLLYTVPGSFLLYKLLSWIGLGVVVYTILLSMKREKPVVVGGAPGAGGPPVGAMPVTPPVVPGGVSDAGATPVASMSGVSTIPDTSAVPPSPGAAPAATAGMGAPLPTMSSGFVGEGSAPVPPAIGAFAAPPPPRGASLMPPSPATTLPRAGFFIRLAAMLLDLLLVAMVVKFSVDFMPRFMPFGDAPGGVAIALALYAALMWKTKGTTVGGIVCGLKVVRIDNREIDWATAFVRALGCFLSFIVVGLGFIWVAIDDERQSWHDKIAGTTVVHVPKGISLL